MIPRVTDETLSEIRALCHRQQGRIDALEVLWIIVASASPSLARGVHGVLEAFARETRADLAAAPDESSREVLQARLDQTHTLIANVKAIQTTVHDPSPTTN